MRDLYNQCVEEDIPFSETVRLRQSGPVTIKLKRGSVVEMPLVTNVLNIYKCLAHT